MTFEGIFRDIRNMLWPQRCVFCSSLIFENEKYTCERCLDSLPFVRENICFGCASEKKYCTCSGNIHYYDKAVSPLYYEGAVKKAVKKLKYKKKKEYASAFASYMTDALEKYLSDEKFDFIACVPLHAKDRRKRGYNQSEMIAEVLSEKTGIPFERDVLTKLYRTKKQTSGDYNERTGNVFGAFSLGENADVSNCSVLLVDDVKTTGSTLSECGKMLFLGGAQRVCCVSTATSAYGKRKNKEVKK